MLRWAVIWARRIEGKKFLACGVRVLRKDLGSINGGQSNGRNERYIQRKRTKSRPENVEYEYGLKNMAKESQC